MNCINKFFSLFHIGKMCAVLKNYQRGIGNVFMELRLLC